MYIWNKIEGSENHFLNESVLGVSDFPALGVDLWTDDGVIGLGLLNTKVGVPAPILEATPEVVGVAGRFPPGDGTPMREGVKTRDF